MEAEQTNQHIHDILHGDRDSYAHIVDAWQDMLLVFAGYRLVDKHAIDEVVQSTFIKAYEKLSEYDTQKNFAVWLRTLCHFEILTWRKQRKRSRYLTNIEMLDDTFGQTDEESDSDELMVQNNLLCNLDNCLSKLPDESRELLTRRYCDDESIATIAQLSDKTATWVSTRLYRIRKNLKDCLESEVTA